ncbi:hypothetical protein HPP92_018177 [Vanilla planifolia]|uniref:Uncharacterized protein n=1 Tax=Vanilla planifolia TaxID=51239 RepID=A0A835UM08_VANPL|nr:hypothetical protein HPP92_018177 [Vanilla planifolia]
MESYLRRRDLPRMFRDTSAVGKQNFHLFELANTNCKLARGGLILNTSENLEGPILAHIRPLFPATYAVGPLHSLVAVISSTNSSASLLLEDHSAIAWLNAQPDRSVVYVRGQRSPLPLGDEEGSGGRVGEAGDEGGGEGEDGGVGATREGVEARGGVLLDAFLMELDSGERGGGYADGVLAAALGSADQQPVGERAVECRIGHEDVCRREVVERTVRAVMEGDTGERLRRAAAEVAGEIGKSV